MNKIIVLLVFLFFVPYFGFSSHITGSYLSLYSTGVANEYQIDLVVFVDKMELTPSGENVLRNTPMTVKIFSKSGNQTMLQQRLAYRKTENLIYENPQCAQIYRLSAGKYIYSAKVTLSPGTYSNTNGYYIAWEYCCRSSVVTNIQRPDQAGLVAYLEFPNLTGQPYRSVDINFSQGDYLCVNQPFSIKFPAQDDKYRLSYAMSTPLNGHNDGINYDSPARPAPYPTVQWGAGFSEQTQIVGSPSLTIDPSTGQMIVTPTMLGTYVFSVTVKQFDGNKQVGATVFNFQFPVVDCPTSPPPKPVVMENGQVATDLYKCPDNTLFIYTDSNNAWNHQWALNGVPITGATQAQLAVNESGKYTVKRSFSNLCGLPILSDTVTVTKVSSGSKPSITTTTPTLCKDDTAYLRTALVDSLEFIWFKSDRTEIGRGAEVQITTGGQYILTTVDKKSGCSLPESSDTISIRNGNEAIVIVPASSIDTILCKGEEAIFSITPNPTYNYQWYRNDTLLAFSEQAQVEVALPGTYYVMVSDTSACSTRSSDFTFGWHDSPAIQFDSIPVICSSTSTFVVLSTFPKGGVYSFPDMRGDTIYVDNLSAGTYPIGYQLSDEYGCQVKVQRELVITASLDLNVPDKVVVPRGGETRITANVSVASTSFLWQPSTFLTSADDKSWITSRPEESIFYFVSATSDNGCPQTDSVYVQVITPLFIPNVFSPNNDGINDVWEIRNIQSYSNAEQFIYNRWGQLVFYNKGGTQLWDGTYQGDKAPAENYTYLIVDSSDGHFSYRGTLLLIR